MKSAWMFWASMAGMIPGAQAQRTAPLVPVLDSYGMIIGASRGGRWISAEKMHTLLRKGDKYRFYTLKGYASRQYRLVRTFLGNDFPFQIREHNYEGITASDLALKVRRRNIEHAVVDETDLPAIR